MAINRSRFQDDIDRIQALFCAERKVTFVQAPADSILGFAHSTAGRIPINGLRHPVQGNTNGWYLWCGEDFSDAKDFFAPMHTRHLYEEYPEVIRLLGLPQGYRFLSAGEYVDVWYDEKLLHV